MKRGCIALVALLIPSALFAQWENWRGPGQRGVSSETGLPATWSLQGENLLWSQPIGGRSTPVVHDGRVYTIGRGGAGIDEHERVVCFDAKSGKVLWMDRFNVFHTTIPGSRVGWSSPCVDPATGNVYTHGVQGLFNAYSPDGKLLWSRSLTEDNGRISGYGGRTNTPVVDGDLVILSFLNSGLGRQGIGHHRFLACDKLTGEIVWWSDPGGKPFDTTYSTPVVTVIGGERVLICGAADGAVYALKVRTGEKIWGFRLSERGFNVSPVVDGERVYIAQSEEALGTTARGTVICINAAATPDAKGDITKTGTVWRTDGLEVGYASPALHGGILYVVDNSANLIAMDAANGKELWRHSLGTVGKGSPVWVDGKIFVGEVNGRFSVLEPSRAGCKQLSRVEFESPRGQVIEIFGSPAIAGGRVYFTTSNGTYCVGEKDWKGKEADPVSWPPETPVSPGDRATHVLVRPAEVTLEPGESVSYRVQLYNERGQLLREATEGVEWSTQGIQGVLDGRGKFSVPVVSGYQFGLVAAKVGSLSGTARVRVVPALPIVEDFERIPDRALPTGWIGVSPPKFRIVERDGSRVLMKHGTRFELPFVRVQTFLAPSKLANYTIQADILGVEYRDPEGNARRNKVPDFGLINQRYRLYFLGSRSANRRKLRIVSWVADRRVLKDESFPWETDTWYTAKFRVEPQGENAVAHARVWKRGDPEPSGWTIEVVDPSPNRRGAPGLYAFSNGTTATSPGPDICFDNVRIFPNE